MRVQKISMCCILRHIIVYRKKGVICHNTLDVISLYFPQLSATFCWVHVKGLKDNPAEETIKVQCYREDWNLEVSIFVDLVCLLKKCWEGRSHFIGILRYPSKKKKSVSYRIWIKYSCFCASCSTSEGLCIFRLTSHSVSLSWLVSKYRSNVLCYFRCCNFQELLLDAWQLLIVMKQESK